MNCTLTPNDNSCNQTNGQNITVVVINQTEAALRYYKTYLKMYLLAESGGPYLNGTLKVIVDEPFELKMDYGDLSSNPELPIIRLDVDLGPSMIMCNYETYMTMFGDPTLRIYSTTQKLIPGNYSIWVTMTNSALMTRRF